MKYNLEVEENDVSSFLYSMLEVYWLSESISTLKIIKDSYGISPTYIERGGNHYFLIKVDKGSKFGYYISSKSLEDLVFNSIDEESKIAAVYANSTSNSRIVDFLLEESLLKIIDEFSKNPSAYQTIPLPILPSGVFNE
tara:strand:+ start:1005 stop:1421 length:417 start_codon:yes stop_codon:yes gene_type:complete